MKPGNEIILKFERVMEFRELTERENKVYQILKKVIAIANLFPPGGFVSKAEESIIPKNKFV